MLTLLRFKIALFFALSTFLMILAQSSLFIGLEYRKDVRRVDADMARDAQRIVEAIDVPSAPRLHVDELSPIDQNAIRLYDADGEPVYIGLFFQGEETPMYEEPWFLEYGDMHHRVLTFPILIEGDVLGYLQVAKPIPTFADRLSDALGTLLALSGILSAVMFIVGLLFEDRAMAPTKQAIRSMEEFAQNAGHELKAPLANIRSSLELARKSERYEQGVDEALHEVKKMARLVDTLLELESLQPSSLEKTAVNLSLLAADVAHSFEASFQEKSLTLSSRIQPDVIRLADAALIRTALAGLLYNAEKFTPAGGKVTVTVTHGYLEIRDTGIGMSPDIANRVFERFFKADTSRSREGFGLGLSLVKRIVQVHGWQIALASTPGKGTAFRMIFPRRKRRGNRTR